MQYTLNNCLTIGATLVGGFFIASCLVVKYVWSPLIDKSKDVLEELEKTELAYEYLYMKEYEILEDEFNSEGEKEEEENEGAAVESEGAEVESEEAEEESEVEGGENENNINYIEETTPKGKVIITYNKKTESFWYYADTTDIPYKYLDTLVRIYCIKYKCKSLYVNTWEEYKKGMEIVREKKETDKKQKESKDKEEKEEKDKQDKKSIFATLKHYNRGVGASQEIPKNKYAILRENSNRYTHKGKLEDFSQENTDSTDACCNVKNISFSEFKRLQEEEKKNQ
jgi:hypothetical protein